MYSYIRFRAGLATLVLVLISISLVSAVPIPCPIPAPQSGLSFSTLLSRSNDYIQLDDNLRVLSKRAQLSRAPAAMRALARRTTDTEDVQLVRRTNVFKKIGNAIKGAAEKVGAGIKKAAEKVESGVKTAVHAVGHFVQTTGAKVAKFGTKVIETVGEVVAKAASFIPDVGKPLEKAIDGVSKVAGVVSDHIHANLSTALQKGMKVMNTANKVMSYF